MEETYFVITNFSGDTRITPYTKEKLLKAIDDGDYGDYVHFFNDVTDGSNDLSYWGSDDILIIKGEVVTPTPVTEIVRHTIK
jgi:hypothetical protein